MENAAEKACALNFIANNGTFILISFFNNSIEFINLNEEDNREEEFGFAREIGSNRGQLSRSQAQRIGIARAIRTNPPVLIVDDVTSGFDVETERLVQESLDRVMNGKTCIILSNKIESLKKADEIVMFSEGRIVERGGYEILNAQQGLFSQLQRDQILDI